MKNADKRYDVGTWGFLGTGWWVAHVTALATVGYAGYYLRKLFKE